MLASTKVITLLTLLAASVSGASIGHGSNQLAHKRHANEVHDSVMQARAARKRDMSDFAKISAEEELAKRSVKKRGTNARRCAMKTASVLASSTASATDASTTAEATSTSVAKAKEATTSSKETTSFVEPTTSSASPTKTKTSTAAAATTSSTSNDGGSSSSSSTGEGTFYATGLGACGITNKDTDYICAVSQLLFDGFEGYTGGDPNSNPICNRKIKATYQGKSVTVTVTDRCVGCAENDLDFSPSAFDQLADESVGRLKGMTWVWV